MRIRNALEIDKSPVLEFCKNTFSWGDYIEDVWESWKSKKRLYVLEDERNVVGVYNLVISEKQAWVEGMRIHPGYRRRGLGKKMQIGYVNGSHDVVLDILRFVQNKAIELNCKRIQVFAQEKIMLHINILDKRSLFYLMRKDQEKSITFGVEASS